MHWSPTQMDRLERAIDEGARIRMVRRGTEMMLLPRLIRHDYGSEVLRATHLGTGDTVDVRLDEVDEFAVLA